MRCKILLLLTFILSMASFSYAADLFNSSNELNKPIDSKYIISDSYIGVYEPSHILDGNVTSEWVSFTSTTEHYITVNLTERASLSKFRMQGRSAGDPVCLGNFVIQYGDDNLIWTNFTQVTTCPAGNTNFYNFSNFNVTAQYVRVYILQARSDTANTEARISEIWLTKSNDSILLLNSVSINTDSGYLPPIDESELLGYANGTASNSSYNIIYQYEWYRNNAKYSDNDYQQRKISCNATEACYYVFDGDNTTYIDKRYYSYFNITSYVSPNTFTVRCTQATDTVYQLDIYNYTSASYNTIQSFCYDGEVYNFTNDYINLSLIQFRFYTSQFAGLRSRLNEIIFDEYFYSNNTYPSNTLANLANISASETTIGENWTFSARTYFNGSFSSWLNSTSVKIYQATIDNCSNINNIPSNATTLNISFFDTSNVRQNVNLTTTITYSGDSSYSNTYYTSHNGINNDTYCIYPNYARLNSNIQFRYVDSSGNYYYNNQILVLSNSTNNLLLYITPSGTSTTFTVKDINTNKVLENALCTSYIELAGNYTGVESKYSDITGKIQFTYLPNNNYKFLCTKTGYLDLIFYLKPILFSAYDVPMTSLSVVNQTQDYDRISIHYYPQNFFNNQQNNFTFIIGSPNELTSYGYTLTWATGSVSNSGTNPTGEQLRNVFDINGLNTFDQMKLDYYYSTASQGTKNFTVYFGISNPASNYTMMANFNRTYGLGIFERVLISVFIVILCAGLGALIGQPVPGYVIGLCVLGYLSFINFFPWWAGAITFVFGAVMVMLRHE